MFRIILITISMLNLGLGAVYPNQPIYATGMGTNDLPYSLVSNTLNKCNQAFTIDECDMCRLCQNGAFCRKQAQSNMNFEHGRGKFKDLNDLNQFIDFKCYCVPGYTGTYCQIDINECLSMPCTNNSTCIDKINKYECKCPKGFAGDHCEVNVNECDSRPCMNNAACLDLVGDYKCECPPGFTGKQCSIDINECESQPCLHNSKCVDMVNKFECDCKGTGFTGRFCESNIDDCENVHCMHNSTCTDLINGYKCECTSGYTGEHCETDINECGNVPCRYGGVCYENSKISPRYPTEYDLPVDKAGYWCDCIPGYTGSNCEIKINECESYPCGSNGKCVDLVNEYKCLCYPGYTGEQCNININECESNVTPCAPQTKCIDLKPDYQNYLSSILQLSNHNVSSHLVLEYNHINPDQNNNDDEDDFSFIYQDGYYCDCSDLNENIYKKSGNRDVIYAGQNCTLKLNACETLKFMCKHDSICQSVLSSNTSASVGRIGNLSAEQDIMCLCKPGYTGKYCEYSTLFRLDGTYFIEHLNKLQIPITNVKFDFRLSPFTDHQAQRPLFYLTQNDELFIEVVLHRKFINIINSEINLDEKIGFFDFDESELKLNSNQWHSLEINYSPNEHKLAVSYSTKKLHLSVLRTIKILKLFQPELIVMGKFYSYLRSDLAKIPDGFVNENLLSSACVRDFTVNSEYLYYYDLESDKNKLNTDELNEVKYGCDCDKKPTSSCPSNTRLIKDWFNDKCSNCEAPLYGRFCQYESTKMLLANRMKSPGEAFNRSFLYLNLNDDQNEYLTENMDLFKLSFQIHRIVWSNMEEADSSSELRFLLLKQKIDNELTNLYEIGINNKGYLYLIIKKLDITNQHFTLPDLIPLLSELEQTSIELVNDKIALNRLDTAYSFKLSLKLNHDLIEFRINDTYSSRFHLINATSSHNNKHQIQIEEILIRNLNDYSEKSFLIYDLNINDYIYEINNQKQSQITILDPKLNYINSIEKMILNNLLIFNWTDNYEIIKQVNKKNQCQNSVVINNNNKSDSFFYSINNLNGTNNLNSSNSASSMASTIHLIENRCLMSYNFKLKNELKHETSVLNTRMNTILEDKNYFYENTDNLDKVFNVTCDSRPFNNNTSYIHSTTSTCKEFSSIQRSLFRLDQSQGPQKPSYVNYYFDFDTLNNNLELTRQQRKLYLAKKYTDYEFYSIGFNLDFYLNDKNENMSRYDFKEIKTNLFTLNTFDDLTTNNVFLFGVNIYARKLFNLTKFNSNLIQFEFELFTNKHSTRSSQPISLISNDSVFINVTFTFDSIELRILNRQNDYITENKENNYQLRLTDKYYPLFWGKLLKAYSPFQLNITSTPEWRNYLNPAKINHDSSKYLINSCISNIVLSTRHSSDLNKTQFSYDQFDLIDQTRSISYFKSSDDYLGFNEQSCSRSIIQRSRILLGKINESDNDVLIDNCYLVSQIDGITGKKLDEMSDCSCSVDEDCTFKFWSKDLPPQFNSSIKPETKSTNRLELITDKQTCAQANDYACFNNGTCVDSPTATFDNDYFKCMCPTTFTGDRCELYDPCLTNPCSPNSTCLIKNVNDQISYECKCNPGFLGRNCTIKFDETCLASPCINGATCLNVTYINDPEKLSYECMCTIGYEGKHCEKKIDYCKLYEPCVNGGTCSNQDHGHSLYKCACPKGWRGVNCTQDIDECTEMRNKFKVPCSNAGTCFNTKGSYVCECNDFHYGENCEFTHICQQEDFDQKPCQNGAVCFAVGHVSENKYGCHCAYGYAGENCSFPTCALKPCQHGVCNMTSETTYECNCTDSGYAGPACENLVNFDECNQLMCFNNYTCDSSYCYCDAINCHEIRERLESKPKDIMYHLILWPLLGIMFGLLTILGTIFFMKVKKSRATRGTYSPSRHEQQASRIEFNMDLKRPPEERLI